LLGYAWSTVGWSALENKDLPQAEIYLRAAWRLCHDRVSGYQLGRLLEAKDNKAAAAHQFELAHVTSVANPLGGFQATNYKVDDLIAAGYRRVAGKELTATSLNHGEYNGSLDAELDKDLEFRQFIRTTKLTGAGLYVVAFEAGKPVKANFLQGDKGFEAFVSALQTHSFPSQLPSGSKARLMREVRIVCSPWAGCDAYLLLPGSIEIPARPILRVTNLPKGRVEEKTVQIEVQP
jgi:hypothetical protein